MSKIAKNKNWDIANGEGIRVSVFFSGCTFNCKGCFNKDIKDFNIGEDFNYEYYEKNIKPLINEHIAGLSILGGEPLHPKNIEATKELIQYFREDFPNKTIWLWTGNSWNDLYEKYNEFYDVTSNAIASMKSMKFINGEIVCEVECDVGDSGDYAYILSNIDVLVDGRFIEEKKDLTLKWRGSKNQRVIDVKKSLKYREVILYTN